MTRWYNDLVSLRQCDPADWPLFHAQRQDSDGYYAFETEVDPPLTEAAAEALWADILSMHEESGRLDLTICAEEEAVGIVSLCLRDEHNGVFTTPVFLLPDWRRKGLARAAMELLLAYAFDERRLHKLQASVLADNHASIALHERLGCTLEGRFAAQIFHDGQWHDELWFGLTEDVWRSRQREARHVL